MNPHIRGSYELRVQSALAAASHAAAIKHPGLKGEVREILVRELLRPLLPPTFAFGTGKVVDHQGNESAQMDVVVYDRAVLPPMLFSDSALTGLFPVEACVYAVEVKSQATAGAWRDSVTKAKLLAGLAYLPDIYGNERPRAIPMLFAFATNLRSGATAQGELTRWKSATPTSAPDVAPPLGVVCVAGQGYGVWFPHKPYDWMNAPGDNSEIVQWMIGVSNTLYEAVGRSPSQFGHYLG